MNIYMNIDVLCIFMVSAVDLVIAKLEPQPHNHSRNMSMNSFEEHVYE